MALKTTLTYALLAALMSLLPALSHADLPQDALAPGIWPTFNGEVHEVLPLADDSYIVGGAFTSVTLDGTTTSRSRLVRVLADGTLDTNFPTANSTVTCLGTDSTGRIYIGGDFTSLTQGATTTPRIRVARLTSSFDVDTAFNTSTAGPLDIVMTLATVGDGSVYIGGKFNGVGTVQTAAVKRMAKLKANGSLDSGFKSGADNDVNDILRLANGTMYVGGFTNYWPAIPPGKFPVPGTALGRLIKISASGARDTAFKPFPPTDAYTQIYSVIQLADGSLLAGGNTGVLRMNASTGAALPYNLPGHGLGYGAVAAIAQQRDGRLLSGGHGTCFLTDSTGAKDASFNITTKLTQAIINTIKIDKAGRIFIGGNFEYDDGVNVRKRLIVLNGTDPRTQSITLPAPANPTFTAGQNVYTLNATASSGLPVTLALTSGNAILAGTKLTILGAGTVVVTASQAGNADFDPASLPVTIEVPLQAQTISFAPLVDRPSGQAPFLLSASASSGLPVQYEVTGPATVSGNRLTLMGPGTVTVTATQAGSANFLKADDVEQSFDVFQGMPMVPLGQSIFFNPLPPRTADETSFSISATASSGLPVTLTVTAGGSIASIANNVVTLSGQAGTVTITATQAGNPSYLAAKAVVQSFKVGPAATAMTLTNLIQTYDGTPKTVGVVGLPGGGSADDIFYTINKVKGLIPPTSVGSYPVEAVVGNLKKTGTLVINRAPLFVVADDKRKFTGQANPALTFAYSGFVGADNPVTALAKVPTVATKATTTSPGGFYPITPAGGGAYNYTLVYVSGNMTVESWAGQYEAIVLDDQEPQRPVGKVEITVLANSTGFTGKFTTAKQTVFVPFKGNLSLNTSLDVATSTVTGVVGKGAETATYSFVMSLPLKGDFSIEVSRAIGTPAGTPVELGKATNGRKLFFHTGTVPPPHAGTYTLMIDGGVTIDITDGPFPKGLGYATAVIDAKGMMTITGALADGTKLTAALLPDIYRSYRLYALPYGARLDSCFAATMDLFPHPTLPGRGYIPESAQRKAYWRKAPNTKDANYRDGVQECHTVLLLDPWLPPATKPAVVTLAQRLALNTESRMAVYHVDLPEGMGDGLPLTATMDAAGKITGETNTRGWKMSITPATGIFTASFTALDGTKPITLNYTGIVRQPVLSEPKPYFIGGGFCLMPQLTGESEGSVSYPIGIEAVRQPAP